MEALIAVNWKYSSADHSDLVYPETDGELMEKLLSDGGYGNITLVENREDIAEVVKEFVRNHNKQLDRFHFHYSGHGTYNATVQLDKDNYTRTLTDKEFETVYATNPGSVSYGDCLIGAGGKLYPVVELKQDLLKLSCAKWTVTLDMCRNEGTRGSRVKSIRKVALRASEPIEDSLLPRIAILYGTSELHVASDYHSFTATLNTVLRSQDLHLPFVEISSRVNEKWKQNKIKQKSKMDVVEVGQNWKNFYWPSKFPFIPAVVSPKNHVASVTQRLFQSQSDHDRHRYAAKLISAMDSLKFLLPKHLHRLSAKLEEDIEKISSFFDDLKAHITKLETTAYKTTMMLFCDLIKKLENDILPSKAEMNDLSLKATEAWNLLGDKDLEEKVKMSKIRLFCKSYEVLFDEETKSFRSFEFLKLNEKRYLSEFMNTEISRLEEISLGQLSGTLTFRKRVNSNLEKYKHFIDEIDQIKRLSYSTIKKDDFAFERDGIISKYWTLNTNMVPEGEDDFLEGLECNFEITKDILVTYKFKVYSDLCSKNWRVEVVSCRPFSSTQSISLCAVERNCNTCSCAVPSLFFPQVEKEASVENRKSWRLDMKHLHYPEREVTLIFCFPGFLDKQQEVQLENVNGSILNTVVEDWMLIRMINEHPVKAINNATVTMSLILCNFLKTNLEIEAPFLTSGKLDSKNPWPRSVDPSSVAFLYSKKKALDARGTVGLTLISFQHNNFPVRIAVYWQAPFDFNIYKNSFAVFPVSSEKGCSSQEVAKIFKSFTQYSNTNQPCELGEGVRGFASDGPQAFIHSGILISVRMGVQHKDYIQVSLLPLQLEV